MLEKSVPSDHLLTGLLIVHFHFASHQGQQVRQLSSLIKSLVLSGHLFLISKASHYSKDSPSNTTTLEVRTLVFEFEDEGIQFSP